MDSFDNHSTVTVDTNVLVHKIEDDLFVFRQTVTTTHLTTEGTLKVPQKASAVTKTEGLVNAANRTALVNGRQFTTIKSLFLMTPELLEVFRTRPFWEAWDSKEFRTAVKDIESVGMFAMFTEFGASADELVQFNSSDHTLMDRNGEYLPVGIFFDYISHGAFHDRNYDLDKVAEVLLENDSVFLRRRQYPDWKGDRADKDASTGQFRRAVTVADAVFNAPSGCDDYSKVMYFVWAPTVEEYRALMAKAAAYPGSSSAKHPVLNIQQAIFETDALGLIAAGANKFPGYYDHHR